MDAEPTENCAGIVIVTQPMLSIRPSLSTVFTTVTERSVWTASSTLATEVFTDQAGNALATIGTRRPTTIKPVTPSAARPDRPRAARLGPVITRPGCRIPNGAG
jgi:hypothetical protein